MAEFVALPGESGELGIYPQHAPLITRIKPSSVRIRVLDQAEAVFVFVAGGLLEVRPKHVIVLADLQSAVKISTKRKRRKSGSAQKIH